MPGFRSSKKNSFALIFVLAAVCSYCSQAQSDQQNSGAQTDKNEKVPTPKTVYVVKTTSLYKSCCNAKKVIAELPVTSILEILADSNTWYRIKTKTGKMGYVKKANTGSKWIKVWKQERKLHVMEHSKIIQSYTIALGFDPESDKIKQGDGSTPEGRFYLCEMLPAPKPAERYGARSMRLSYPNLEDAKRGLKSNLISRKQYLNIHKAIMDGKTPLQNTTLGSSIRIHGGGSGNDWTLGCIALDDQDIVELYKQLPAKNAMIEVYKSRKYDSLLNLPDFTERVLLQSSMAQFDFNTKYTNQALGIIPVKYPFGDFDKSIGVCTDLVIRSLRPLGIDLQSLLYEDILRHPNRYPKIKKANTNIDHRRTRNLKIWFDHHALTLTNKTPQEAPDQWKAGDIVLMDTGVENGTIYDHIGIVSDTQIKGRPAVINLWTVGYELAEMDLLDGKYPKIVGHYRMLHPFDYNAFPIGYD